MLNSIALTKLNTKKLVIPASITIPPPCGSTYTVSDTISALTTTENSQEQT